MMSHDPMRMSNVNRVLMNCLPCGCISSGERQSWKRLKTGAGSVWLLWFIVSLFLFSACSGSGEEQSVTVVKTLAEQPESLVAYGKEFWKPQSLVNQGGEPNLSEIVQRADAAFRTDPATGAVQARVRGFKATVEKDGLRLSLPAAKKAKNGQGELEVSLGTAAIRQRGDALASKDAGGWSVLGNTAQRRLDDDGAVLEHYESRRDHMAVTWVLQHAPAGDGDLSIDYQIGDLVASKQTAKGWLFADKEGQNRLRLGPAVAVDAHGKRWKLQTTAQENMAQITLPETVLASAAFPLAVDPEIGVEVDLPNDPNGTGLNSVTDESPVKVIQISEETLLVLWYGETSDKLYGVRVNLTNQSVVDPNGFLIQDGDLGSNFSAAHQGNVVAMAWRMGSDALVTKIVTVPDNGTPTISDETEILDAGTDISASQLLSYGTTDFALFWVRSNSGEAWYRVIHADGSFGSDIKTASISGLTFMAVHALPQQNGYIQLLGAITNEGTNIVWSMQRLDDQLIPTGDVIYLDQDIYPMSLDCLETSCMASYRDENLDLGAALLWGLDGTPQWTELTSSVLSTGDSVLGSSLVAAQNGAYLLAWGNVVSTGEAEPSYQIKAQRFNPDGTALDNEAVVLSQSSVEPRGMAYASTGDYEGYLLRPSGTSSNREVLLDKLDFSVSPMRRTDTLPVVLTQGLYDQQAPSVAATDDTFLIVWKSDVNYPTSGYDIFGLRLDRISGTPLETAGFAISQEQGDQGNPSVHSDGENFLVVWESLAVDTNGRDLVGRRVRATDGVLMDAAGISICNAQESQKEARIASDGSDYVVVWEDDRNDQADLYGTTVSSVTGSISPENGSAISALSTSDEKNVAIASNGSNFLVTWDDGTNVYATRMGEDLIPTDSPALTIHTGVEPTVASDGTDYLLVFAEDLGSNQYDLRNQVVPGTGTMDSSVVDSFSGSGYTSSSLLSNPNLVRLGNSSEMLVIWEQNRGESGTLYGCAVHSLTDPQFDCSVDGTTYLGWLVDSFGSSPNLASGSLDKALLTFQKSTLSSSGKNLSAYRFISTSSCLIDSVSYARDVANSTDGCQLCDPIRNPSGWSNRLCQGVQICQSGACQDLPVLELGTSGTFTEDFEDESLWRQRFYTRSIKHGRIRPLAITCDTDEYGQWYYDSNHTSTFLAMDSDTNGEDGKSELVFALNLADVTQTMTLSFDHRSFHDEPHPHYYSSWTNALEYGGDGMAISTDGITWYRWSKPNQSDPSISPFFHDNEADDLNWDTFSLTIDPTNLPGGLTASNPTYMMFFQRDNYPMGSDGDGRGFDNISVSCTPDCGTKICGPDGCGGQCNGGCADPRMACLANGTQCSNVIEDFPFKEDFEDDTLSSIWQTSSSESDGRFRVMDVASLDGDQRKTRKALVMDVSQAWIENDNRLTLNVNTATEKNLVLSYRFRAHLDENRTLPSSYPDGGTVHGDGVAIRCNGGAEWYKLADLHAYEVSTWTRHEIDLSTACAEDGMSQLPDQIQIRFYQFDNYMWPDDGIALDDIEIRTGSVCVPDCTGVTCGDDGCGGICDSCSDGNPCNGVEYCDELDLLCVSPGVMVCDSRPDDNPCLAEQGTCDPTQGCVYEPKVEGFSCDSDNDACTVEQCNGSGACIQPSTILCDDGNPCTVGTCNQSTGGCDYAPVPNEPKVDCDDGNVCTYNDACSDGACVGTQVSCDDGNLCTIDLCDLQTGECQNSPKCESNDACSFAWCNPSDGECQYLAKTCDDKNPCTIDSCDPNSGCNHALEPDLTACDDSNPCSGSDTCQAGICLGSPVSDESECTEGYPENTGSISQGGWVIETEDVVIANVMGERSDYRSVKRIQELSNENKDDYGIINLHSGLNIYTHYNHQAMSSDPSPTYKTTLESKSYPSGKPLSSVPLWEGWSSQEARKNFMAFVDIDKDGEKEIIYAGSSLSVGNKWGLMDTRYGHLTKLAEFDAPGEIMALTASRTDSGSPFVALAYKTGGSGIVVKPYLIEQVTEETEEGTETYWTATDEGLYANAVSSNDAPSVFRMASDGQGVIVAVQEDYSDPLSFVAYNWYGELLSINGGFSTDRTGFVDLKLCGGQIQGVYQAETNRVVFLRYSIQENGEIAESISAVRYIADVERAVCIDESSGSRLPRKVVWTGAEGNGSFTDPGNWQYQFVPDELDYVEITLDSGDTVSVDDAGVDVKLDGLSLQLASGSQFVTSSSVNVGDLVVDGTGSFMVNSNEVFVESLTMKSSSADIAGTESLNLNGHFTVAFDGDFSDSNLNITFTGEKSSVIRTLYEDHSITLGKVSVAKASPGRFVIVDPSLGSFNAQSLNSGVDFVGTFVVSRGVSASFQQEINVEGAGIIKSYGDMFEAPGITTNGVSVGVIGQEFGEAQLNLTGGGGKGTLEVTGELVLKNAQASVASAPVKVTSPGVSNDYINIENTVLSYVTPPSLSTPYVEVINNGDQSVRLNAYNVDIWHAGVDEAGMLDYMEKNWNSFDQDDVIYFVGNVDNILNNIRLGGRLFPSWLFPPLNSASSKDFEFVSRVGFVDGTNCDIWPKEVRTYGDDGNGVDFADEVIALSSGSLSDYLYGLSAELDNVAPNKFLAFGSKYGLDIVDGTFYFPGQQSMQILAVVDPVAEIGMAISSNLICMPYELKNGSCELFELAGGNAGSGSVELEDGRILKYQLSSTGNIKLLIRSKPREGGECICNQESSSKSCYWEEYKESYGEECTTTSMLMTSDNIDIKTSVSGPYQVDDGDGNEYPVSGYYELYLRDVNPILVADNISAWYPNSDTALGDGKLGAKIVVESTYEKQKGENEEWPSWRKILAAETRSIAILAADTVKGVVEIESSNAHTILDKVRIGATGANYVVGTEIDRSSTLGLGNYDINCSGSEGDVDIRQGAIGACNMTKHKIKVDGVNSSDIEIHAELQLPYIATPYDGIATASARVYERTPVASTHGANKIPVQYSSGVTCDDGGHWIDNQFNICSSGVTRRLDYSALYRDLDNIINNELASEVKDNLYELYDKDSFLSLPPEAIEERHHVAGDATSIPYEMEICVGTLSCGEWFDDPDGGGNDSDCSSNNTYSCYVISGGIIDIIWTRVDKLVDGSNFVYEAFTGLGDIPPREELWLEATLRIQSPQVGTVPVVDRIEDYFNENNGNRPSLTGFEWVSEDHSDSVHTMMMASRGQIINIKYYNAMYDGLRTGVVTHKWGDISKYLMMLGAYVGPHEEGHDDYVNMISSLYWMRDADLWSEGSASIDVSAIRQREMQDMMSSLDEKYEHDVISSTTVAKSLVKHNILGLNYGMFTVPWNAGKYPSLERMFEKWEDLESNQDLFLKDVRERERNLNNQRDLENLFTNLADINMESSADLARAANNSAMEMAATLAKMQMLAERLKVAYYSALRSVEMYGCKTGAGAEYCYDGFINSSVCDIECDFFDEDGAIDEEEMTPQHRLIRNLFNACENDVPDWASEFNSLATNTSNLMNGLNSGKDKVDNILTSVEGLKDRADSIDIDWVKGSVNTAAEIAGDVLDVMEELDDVFELTGPIGAILNAAVSIISWIWNDEPECSEHVQDLNETILLNYLNDAQTAQSLIETTKTTTQMLLLTIDGFKVQLENYRTIAEQYERIRQRHEAWKEDVETWSWGICEQNIYAKEDIYGLCVQHVNAMDVMKREMYTMSQILNTTVGSPSQPPYISVPPVFGFNGTTTQTDMFYDTQRYGFYNSLWDGEDDDEDGIVWSNVYSLNDDVAASDNPLPVLLYNTMRDGIWPLAIGISAESDKTGYVRKTLYRKNCSDNGNMEHEQEYCYRKIDLGNEESAAEYCYNNPDEPNCTCPAGDRFLSNGYTYFDVTLEDLYDNGNGKSVCEFVDTPNNETIPILPLIVQDAYYEIYYQPGPDDMIENSPTPDETAYCLCRTASVSEVQTCIYYRLECTTDPDTGEEECDYEEILVESNPPGHLETVSCNPSWEPGANGLRFGGTDAHTYLLPINSGVIIPGRCNGNDSSDARWQSMVDPDTGKKYGACVETADVNIDYCMATSTMLCDLDSDGYAVASYKNPAVISPQNLMSDWYEHNKDTNITGIKLAAFRGLPVLGRWLLSWGQGNTYNVIQSLNGKSNDLGKVDILEQSVCLGQSESIDIEPPYTHDHYYVPGGLYDGTDVGTDENFKPEWNLNRIKKIDVVFVVSRLPGTHQYYDVCQE